MTTRSDAPTASVRKALPKEQGPAMCGAWGKTRLFLPLIVTRQYMARNNGRSEKT